MLSDMQDAETLTRVPIMYGWTVHDGGVELEDQIETEDEKWMTSQEYNIFWERFVGKGTEAERTYAKFEADDYDKYGKYSAEMMAALDVITTSQYECGVYSMVTEDSENADLFAYVFDDRKSGSKLVEHG